jgi:ATP-binding cassette subfamily B protein
MSQQYEATEEEFGKRFDAALWKRLLGYVFRYRKTSIRFAVGAGLLGMVETAFPIINQMLIDDVASDRENVDLVAYGAVYMALTLALAFFIWLFVYCGGRIRTHVAHDIRKDAFANLQLLSFSYYDLRPVGWLMARMTSDCDRLSQILAWGLMDCVWGFTMMIAVSVAMFAYNAKLALAVVIVVPLLAWISGWFQVRILKTSRKVRKTNSKLTAAYNEGIMGIRTSKVFVRESRNLGDFQGLAGEMYGDSVRNALLNAAYLPIVLTITSLAIGLTLAVGGVQVVAGAISIGTLIMFTGFARLFFQPIQELSAWFAELQMAQASAERIIGLIEAVPEIRDSEEVKASVETHPSEFGTIDFQGVGFCYRGGQRVLEGFDLRVEAGETVALVGATGGGKTTIVNLLCRFYEPTEGSILFDGVDYRQRSLEWLHGNLGIVLQQPHLFRGSVRTNIRYGRLEATDAEVEEAATMAGAHDFVSALEKGYETDVGEGGNRLSGGQRQLVSLARALLARPRILVMDEATSSVDTETELRIQAGVERVLEGRTSFVIAHRLSTIRRADRILVIEQGAIVEQGSHDALLERQGAYYDLYMQQSLRDAVRLDAAWAADEG